MGILLKYQRIQTHNKRLKRDCQRVAFPVPMSRGVSVVVFEFSGYALPAP
ncbi:Uncharacterised protein [Vibrio cholerae]|nr:Uncharacterised protein [Vibrio cholerae]